MILDFNAPLRKVIEALSKRLTFAENMQAIEYDISDTGVADTEITVTHKLGKTPRLYIYNIDRAGTVYDSRRDDWTSSVMYVKCSAANAVVTLTIT